MADLLVHVPYRAGGLDRGGLGLLSRAAAVAAELGGDADALVVGTAELDAVDLAALGGFGARTVFRAAGAAGVSQPVVDAMDAVISARGHRYALFAGGVIGLEAGGALAGRRRGGVVVDVTALRIERSELIVERPVFDDSSLAVVRFTGELGVAVARMDAFEGVADPGRPAAEVLYVVAEPSPWGTQLEVLGHGTGPDTGLAIEDADILVAGGRGLGGAEGFRLIEELAAAFGDGAAVAASRAAVDAGWYPYEHQVGQTGKTVTPKLYLAAGISGAIQHRVGMSGAEHIVAINIAADAPILELADLGVVGDLNAILPKLAAAIRARRGG